jgi:hypothetical protein
MIQSAAKSHPQLKVVWVSQRLSHSRNGIIFVKPQLVQEQDLWVGADLMLTVGGSRSSFVPLHVQCLFQGIPVVTDEKGDHGEWVNHLFAGIVLSHKGMAKELRHYFHLLAREPECLEQFRRNGQALVQKIIGARLDAKQTDGKHDHSDQG